MSYTTGFDFSQLNVENCDIHSSTRKECKNAWCRILHCSTEELESLIGDDDMLHFDSRLPIFSYEFTDRKEHVVEGDVTLAKYWPKVATYPSIIHSPLRVLNMRDSAFFPKAVKELEYIITKGDMTFTREFPLGYSGVGNIAFLLSRNKSFVIIMLADGSVFNKHKNDGVVSKDGFACFLPYEIIGKAYPVIMVDSEDLESAYAKGNDAETQIIAAYQNDILEMFAYSIMGCSKLLPTEQWTIPVLKTGLQSEVTDEHRQFAEAFVKRYTMNK